MPPPANTISVLIASPEISPYAKSGGLGDVIASLPAALAGAGVGVSLVMPAYRCVLNGGYTLEETGIRLSVPVARRRDETEVLRITTGDGIPVYLVRADRYFDRDDLYGTPDGDYPDNAERFVFFSRAVLELTKLLQPQVLHANDWQTALAVAFVKAQPDLYPELAALKTVMTVHNLGYQGQFKAADWQLLDLDRSLFSPRYLEFYGGINFLKGGIVFADAVTTVSPTYAEEIKTAEQGFGLEGVFQERADRLSGILNGVDYRTWNPQTDGLIARRYGPRGLAGKGVCKADLQRYFGLDEDGAVPGYRHGNPAVGAEGYGPGHGRLRRPAPAPLPVCAAGIGRPGVAGRGGPSGASDTGDRSGSKSASAKNWRTGSSPAAISCSCPPGTNPAA